MPVGRALLHSLALAARQVKGKEKDVNDLVFYASYASNMLARRFRLYLEGGRLGDTGRAHHGARDPSRPRWSAPCWLPGTAYFGTWSEDWDGAPALYDPLTPGRTAARAWLITRQQLCDVAAQEMHREPGEDLELPSVPGQSWGTGPGRYEVLACTGLLAGHPVITLAAPWRCASIPAGAPSPSYAAVIRDGLRESHGWDMARCARYVTSMITAGKESQ